jgi:hypothetical protein
VSDDRTPDDLGMHPSPAGGPGGSAAASPPVTEAAQDRRGAAGQVTEAGCQKPDWLAQTAQLPVTDAGTHAGTPADLGELVAAMLAERSRTTAAEPTTELPLIGPAQTEAPAEPGSDRLRRWGREYGAYLAAGGLALVVLVCSVTGLSRAGMVWHPANPVAVASPSSPAPSPAPAVRPASPAAASPSPSRSRSAKRPVAAAATRSQDPPAPAASPAPSPVLLGPDSGRGVAQLVDAHCRRSNRSAVLLRPWPDAGAVGNWACQQEQRRGWPRGADTDVADLDAACAQRYGRGAVARYLDAADPFSWRCYRA